MSFTLDPVIASRLEAMRPDTVTPSPPRGDIATRRARSAEMFAGVAQIFPPTDDIHISEYHVPVDEGTIMVRWYVPPQPNYPSAPGPAVVFLHGGGMIAGSVNEHHPIVAAYVRSSGVPFLSVDYRLAPGSRGPVPVGDCFAALCWLRDHAEVLGVDPRRIAVMGDSAGGGLAAGVAIAARDASVPVARQILVYPMLDDRTVVLDPHLLPFATWTYDDNYTGWHALLGDQIGGADVSPQVAPARLEDHAELAPAYIEVGELDIFREESTAYARALARAGVSTELIVRPGATHGFDVITIGTDLSDRAFEDRRRAISSF